MKPLSDKNIRYKYHLMYKSCVSFTKWHVHSVYI